MPHDVRTKLYEIIRAAEARSFGDEHELARHLRQHSLQSGEPTAFHLPGTRVGNAETVCSELSIRKNVEFAARLRLVHFYQGELLPYDPLVRFTDEVDEIISAELWAYLDREGVSRKKLRAAMKASTVRDPMSLWGKFPVRRIARDDFRRCIYLLSQLPSEIVLNRRWTYHFRDDLEPAS